VGSKTLRARAEEKRVEMARKVEERRERARAEEKRRMDVAFVVRVPPLRLPHLPLALTLIGAGTQPN
jgi:hypothetical protein